MTPLEGLITALVCIVAIIVGVTMYGGLPLALIVGGALGLVVVALLYDPKARRGKKTQAGGLLRSG